VIPSHGGIEIGLWPPPKTFRLAGAVDVPARPQARPGARHNLHNAAQRSESLAQQVQASLPPPDSASCRAHLTRRLQEIRQALGSRRGPFFSTSAGTLRPARCLEVAPQGSKEIFIHPTRSLPPAGEDECGPDRARSTEQKERKNRVGSWPTTPGARQRCLSNVAEVRCARRWRAHSWIAVAKLTATPKVVRCHALVGHHGVRAWKLAASSRSCGGSRCKPPPRLPHRSAARPRAQLWTSPRPPGEARQPSNRRRKVR